MKSDRVLNTHAAASASGSMGSGAAFSRFILALGIGMLPSLTGCATVHGVMALRQVEFRYDRTSDPAVAGIPVARLASYDDLSVTDVAKLMLAVTEGDVPLDLTVHVQARNPETNDVAARMVAMDWTYLVDDREIITGQLAEPLSLLPGAPRDVPLRVSFNLARFFGSDGRDLFDTALALAGATTSTKRAVLRIEPTIDTAVGPIRYPAPISLPLSRG